MVKVTFPEPEMLAPDQKLTDDQTKAIDEIKNEDWNAPPAKADDKAPAKKPEDETKPEPEKKEGEEKDDQKSPEEIAAEEAEAAETARLDKKSKELGKTVDEVKETEKAEKTEQERLEKVAKEENRTVEEVKADEAKDKTVAERHGNDPAKIARALRKEQSEYGKVKAEHDRLVKFEEEVKAENARFKEASFEVQMTKGREDIIAKYREKFTKQADGTPTEELSDDACFERGKVVIREALKSRESAFNEKVKTDAATRRGELIKTIPEEFKDFVPEIKTLIEECGDRQVLDKEFDVSFLANYARGKKYTTEHIKSLEEAAYKRGVEQAKIIPKVPSGKPSGEKSTGGKGSSLTDTQKTRAEEMYGRREGWTKTQMWDTYAKDDLNKDF